MNFGIFTMLTNMGATWFSEGCGPTGTYLEGNDSPKVKSVTFEGLQSKKLATCSSKDQPMARQWLVKMVSCTDWTKLRKGGVLTALNRSNCPPIGGKGCPCRVRDTCSLSSRHHSESQARKLQNNPPLTPTKYLVLTYLVTYIPTSLLLPIYYHPTTYMKLLG